MTLARRPADAGISDSQVYVGWMNESGLGVKQDYTEAMNWYRKAADQNNAQAENNIGRLYRNGLGVNQDETEAVSWFRKAAGKGNKDATTNLLALYAQGKVPGGPSEATMPIMPMCADKATQVCVSAPQPIHQPEPEYSKQAREAKYQGTCVIALVVEPDGSASHVSMISGLGMGLDEKAIEAVKAWTFKPAMKDGKPVRVAIAVEVEFHLY